MRRRHKLAAGVSASAAALGIALIQAWTAHERAAVDMAALVNRGDFERAVALCEASGGRWWRGECEKIAPSGERGP